MGESLDQKTALRAHLKDFKKMLVRVVLAWLVGIGVAAYFQQEVLDFYLAPISKTTLNWLSPTDPVFFLMKIYMFTGFIFSFPIIVVSIWQFVKLGLKERERKFAGSYIVSVVFLSFFAVFYGYIWLVPLSLRFLLEIEVMGVQSSITAFNYLDFFISIFIILILVFQMPVLVYSLIRTGMVPIEVFQKHRKEVYFAILVLVFFLTPGDITISIFTLTPVAVLYESSLLISRWGLNRRRRKEEKKLRSADSS